ncbi:MAG: lipid-A-disaccharide synthase, partial [Pseudomonadota bacterium]
MRAEGCDIHWDASELSVMGLIDPIRHLPRLYCRFRSLIAFLKRHKPDVVVGIDAPDFTLRVERVMKAQGCRIVHYVSPSVWAWRQGRVDSMKQFVDEVLTLFPFETNIYTQKNMRATCVGHPLADRMPLHPVQAQRTNVRASLGLQGANPIVALLPGSRVHEIERHLPLYLDVARQLMAVFPHIQFVSAIPAESLKPVWSKILQQYPEVPVKVEAATAASALMACDVALLTSGTVTLEALLAKRPMVIAYKMGRLTYWLAKKLVRIPYFGLPNLLAQKQLVPEFLQEAATADRLFQAVSLYLGTTVGAADGAEPQALHQAFEEIHRLLARQGSARAAERVLSHIDMPAKV